MSIPKSIFVCVSILLLAFLGCQPGSSMHKSHIPGIYHIRIELGNSWAGREDEIYIDYDSSKTTQTMNHFKYDATDSIIYNKTYQLDNKVMDSLFLYSTGVIREESVFDYDKYAPADGHNVSVEVIANDRMIQCNYTNIQLASHASPQLGKLARLINANAENASLIK